LPFVLFVIGVVVVVWATERLLEGLVGLAGLLRVSAFAVAAVLSGFEAENVAVGLAAARKGAQEMALGTVFGGAIILVCVALGLGAMLYPLRVNLPRGFLILMAVCPVLVGLGCLGERTPRSAGVLLLVAFFVAILYLVRVSREHVFLESEEVREAEEKRYSFPIAAGLTVLGLVVIAVGGELVTEGAEGIVSVLGLSALLVGMVVTPAAIEVEEVIRQASCSGGTPGGLGGQPGRDAAVLPVVQPGPDRPDLSGASGSAGASLRLALPGSGHLARNPLLRPRSWRVRCSSPPTPSTQPSVPSSCRVLLAAAVAAALVARQPTALAGALITHSFSPPPSRLRDTHRSSRPHSSGRWVRDP
jgi:Sodium/calcium exchanger protein